jgi:hypothetical protein
MTNTEYLELELPLDHLGHQREPIYQGPAAIWWHPDFNQEKTYSLYNFGTNDTRIIEFNPRTNSYKRVQLEEVENLHGLFYRLLETISLLKVNGRKISYD